MLIPAKMFVHSGLIGIGRVIWNYVKDSAKMRISSIIHTSENTVRFS